MQNLTFSRVSYERLSLSTIASIQVCAPTPRTANRRNTVTVQDPTALFIRQDGQVTIQAANKANTRTLDLRGKVLMLTAYDGSFDMVSLA